MTKNRKLIATIISLNVFFALPCVSFAKKNNKQFESILTNMIDSDKQLYYITLHFNSENISGDKHNLLKKIFIYYLSSNIPGISDKTIKESFFTQQFIENKYTENRQRLLLNSEEIKNFKKYYTKEKIKKLLKEDVKNYDQLLSKVISIYDENINDLKEYRNYLKGEKTNDFYIKQSKKIKNRDKTKIDLIKNEEILTKEKELEKAKEACKNDYIVTGLLIDKYEKQKKELKKIKKEEFQNFKNSCENLDSLMEEKNFKIIRKDFNNLKLKLNFSPNFKNADKIYTDISMEFIAKCLYNIMKRDKKNKTIQNYIKKNKEKIDKENKKNKENKNHYTNYKDFEKIIPLKIYINKGNFFSSDLTLSFCKIKNVKEAKMIVKYLKSKEFEKEFNERNFEKFINDILEIANKYKKHKEEKIKTGSLEKEIEKVKKRKKDYIKRIEKELKKLEKNVHKNYYKIKSKKRSVEKEKKYLKDEKQITEDARENLEKKKYYRSDSRMDADVWIKKIKNISYKNFNEIYKTMDLTKIEIK